jgi:hypothetical protein
LAKRLFASRRRVFAAGVIAAVVTVVTAGYGYAAITATNQSYTGCLLSGTITSVAKGSDPLKPCSNNAEQISWNQTGPKGEPGNNGTNGTNGTDGTNGTNGVSVTSGTEPAGANCAYGGAKFTAADNNVTYACNGAPGEKGDPGAAGSGGPLAYAYVDHGVLDQSRTVGVNSMTLNLVPGGAGDVYCFDLVGTPANVIGFRALGSGNSGGVGATVAGTGQMPASCAPGTDAAVVSGINGTSSFFVLFN